MMFAALFCGLAFAAAFLAGRRSLVNGIGVVVAVGYFYGIIRANLPNALSYFVFDAAVLGLYLARMAARERTPDGDRLRRLRHWVFLLAGWPILLLLFPVQDPMVQLVGLRAHVFMLPFLLFGARLDRDDWGVLALYIAALNVVAFAFAGGEFFFGVDKFYPENPVTDIIYRSRDVRGSGDLLGAFRIPATFANSASYGAAMVITFPILLGAWVQRSGTHLGRVLLTLGLAASVLGTFLAASRTNALILLVLLTISMLSGRIGAAGRVAWMVMVAGIGWVVMLDERLFARLVAIGPEAIANRMAVSLNQTFVNFAFEYPMGNGLGGGGTSLPYFLQHLVHNPIWIESQYATFMMEMGLPGLLLWVGFIVWVFTRRNTPRSDPWHLGRRLAWWACAAFYANGLIGIGFLTAVPFSALLLLCTGWISVRQGERAPEPAAAPRDAYGPRPWPPLPAHA